MTYAPILTAILFLSFAAPALAQLGPGGGGGPLGGGGAPQPQARTPDIAPPALPGAGAAPPVATGPVVQKAGVGDPTASLFTAVSKGDYNAAQDAISRGANLDAQNPFGETPLDLSVALNRTTITFLLLSTRNELGDNSSGGAPAGPMAHTKLKAIHADAEPAPLTLAKPAPVNVSASPNLAAGFYGFGPKS
jgi:hypothetical protein